MNLSVIVNKHFFKELGHSWSVTETSCYLCTNFGVSIIKSISNF